MEEVFELMLFNQAGRFGPPGRFVHHGWWWGFWGRFIPLILFLVLIGLVVWAVLRVSGRGFGPATGSAGLAPAFARDPALEEVRLRYARGEMSREEFVQRSWDLGGRAEGTRSSGSTMAPPGETEPGEPVPPPEPEAG
jgi:putative membrane protein